MGSRLETVINSRGFPSLLKTMLIFKMMSVCAFTFQPLKIELKLTVTTEEKISC